MKSQSTLFQGAKRLNNVLLGIETFFMALITIALVAAIFIEGLIAKVKVTFRG